jgi:hypothetical protein
MFSSNGELMEIDKFEADKNSAKHFTLIKSLTLETNAKISEEMTLRIFFCSQNLFL